MTKYIVRRRAVHWFAQGTCMPVTGGLVFRFAIEAIFYRSGKSNAPWAHTKKSPSQILLFLQSLYPRGCFFPHRPKMGIFGSFFGLFLGPGRIFSCIGPFPVGPVVRISFFCRSGTAVSVLQNTPASFAEHTLPLDRMTSQLRRIRFLSEAKKPSGLRP